MILAAAVTTPHMKDTHVREDWELGKSIVWNWFDDQWGIQCEDLRMHVLSWLLEGSQVQLRFLQWHLRVFLYQQKQGVPRSGEDSLSALLNLLNFFIRTKSEWAWESYLGKRKRRRSTSTRLFRMSMISSLSLRKNKAPSLPEWRPIKVKPRNSTETRNKEVKHESDLAAVLKLKQSKMLQKELNKVEGMYILLTQQKIILEGNSDLTKKALESM